MFTLLVASSASEENSICTSGGLKGELIEGEALSTSGENSFSGLGAESKCADIELGDFEESFVVGDGGNRNNDSGVSVLNVFKVFHDSGDGNGPSVSAGTVQSLENDFVELGISSSGEESVQSDEKSEVGVSGLGRSDLSVANSTAGLKIDTHVVIPC